MFYPKHLQSVYGNFIFALLIAGMVILFTSVGETVKAEQVLWYAFEGSGDIVKDVSGNGNDGTITGAKRVPGKFGKGISIGKKDEYVEIPDVLQQKANPAGTILFWFKPNWNGGDGQSYRLFDANTGAIYWLIGQGKEGGTQVGNFGFWFEDAADADFQNWQTPAKDLISAGKWHHVAATWDFDKSEAKFYVNGKEISNVGGMGTFPPLNPKPKIGFNVGTGYMAATNGADSVIDEFAIYNEALDEKAVKTEMET
ncbi:TPA: LamG domain-containing protein, partial [Candidatus Poribacteria bacterium]|nr:LamG domain-containing protein [Candidatus Poribacteria bacterium]